MERINYDWEAIDLLANALMDRNMDLVDEVDRQTKDWLEGVDEKQSREKLICAIRQAIEELENCE